MTHLRSFSRIPALRGPSTWRRGMCVLALLLLAAACADDSDAPVPPRHKLTILYTGSTDGAIWPCYGCSAEPQGGMARRATFIRHKRQENAELLLFDSGDMLSARGRALGDRKMLELYDLLAYDAVNIGDQEFINGKVFFFDEVLHSHLPTVSASLSSDATHELLAPPYRVCVRGDVRVGVLGLVDAQAFMSLDPDLYDGVRIASVGAAVARYLPELRARCDFLVVVSNLGSEGDRDLAQEVPEIDVVIGGHSGSASRQPTRVGETLIVRPGAGGRHVGVLELGLDAAFRIQDVSNELVTMDTDIAADSTVVARVAGVQIWEAGSQKEMVPSVQTGRLHTESTRCAGCHAEAFAAWSRHGHARAFDILQPEMRGNLGCLPCHTTGWAKGGYIDAERTPELQHVGCTSCHDMRRKHLSWPEKSPVPEVTAETCRRCHTPKWTPDFDFQQYWSRIKH